MRSLAYELGEPRIRTPVSMLLTFHRFDTFSRHSGMVRGMSNTPLPPPVPTPATIIISLLRVIFPQPDYESNPDAWFDWHQWIDGETVDLHHAEMERVWLNLWHDPTARNVPDHEPPARGLPSGLLRRREQGIGYDHSRRGQRDRDRSHR